MCKSFALYLCWHRFATMPHWNERQRGEAIRFFLRGEDEISVPGRFHVSQSTLSRLRRRMLTTGSLNDHFRSGHPSVATRGQDQETPLLHLRNRFQAAVKTAVHFWTHKSKNGQGRQVLLRTDRTKVCHLRATVMLEWTGYVNIVAIDFPCNVCRPFLHRLILLACLNFKLYLSCL
jgi:transposase